MMKDAPPSGETEDSRPTMMRLMNDNDSDASDGDERGDYAKTWMP